MNITIAGGGASGWLTALYINKIYPKSQISLIESEEIGILGVGEGSVPLLVSTLRKLNIDLNDLIKDTNATFKLGISFENWKGIGDKYFHGFNLTGLVPNSFITPEVPYFNINDTISYPILLNLIGNSYDLNYTLGGFLGYNNKILYYDNVIGKDFYDTLHPFSFHFDATLLTKFLRKIGEERGIKRYEGKIKSINSLSNGDIDSINTNKDKIKCDFVFDCTGFSRLIIGKHYKSKWVTSKDKLKLNSAISFTLDPEDNIDPYTKAIAMDNGWMWMIPLQNRIGCGYIFDKNYIDQKQAHQEIEKYFNKTININKHIEFEAGFYKDVWVNNCIAIGLSTGFAEPLEATSLMISLTQLEWLDKSKLKLNTKHYRKIYNDLFFNEFSSIIDFLQYHYLTDRNDTEFWKNYKKDLKYSPKLKNILNNLKSIPISPLYFNNNSTIFNPLSYVIVGLGISNQLINKEVNKEENDILDLNNKLKGWHLRYKESLKFGYENSLNHTELLESINLNLIKI